MKKIDKLDQKVQRGKFQHTQHSKEFYKELNQPKEVSEPFRLLDMKWKFGKYKGQKVEDTPIQYIQWVFNNFSSLSKTHKSILKTFLPKENQ